MKITVCIGSSCHVKGSRQVVMELQKLISEHQLENQIELSGMFCMNRCQQGVCVMADDRFYSVTPESVEDFFVQNILEKLK